MERTERTTKIWATLGVVAMLAMVLPALAVAPAGASAPPGTTSADLAASASASQQWAYGGSKWVNVSLQLGNASYDSHAFFGWQVVFTATNTSNGTVEFEAQRTMAASLFANYTSPSSSGNLSIQGQESDTGFANLTTQSQVYENGSATPAVGIDNASSTSSARLNESFRLSVGAHNANAHLTVSGNSHGTVAFTPSLGLVPWNAAPNTTWNSSAAYAASGAWALAYQYGGTSLLGTTVSGSGNPNGSVTGTGTVDLVGADLGTITLANGRTVPVIAIGITGPFDDVDGFLLVPHGFEIFGAGHHDWDAHSFGEEAVATSRLDIVLDATGHRFQVVASATSYAGSETGLTTAPSVANIAPAGAAPNASALVQGQPETVAQAQHASVCLTTDCSATTGTAGTLLPFLLVGLVAVVLVGTVGVVEYRAWSRRKSGGGSLVGGYSQQVPMAPSAGLPPPPQGPAPPMPPSGGA